MFFQVRRHRKRNESGYPDGLCQVEVRKREETDNEQEVGVNV